MINATDIANAMLEGESPKDFMKRRGGDFKRDKLSRDPLVRHWKKELLRYAVGVDGNRDDVPPPETLMALFVAAFTAFGVPPVNARRIGYEIGASSQVIVNRHYMANYEELSGVPLNRAAELTRFYYTLVSGKADADELYDKYVA